MFNDDIFETEKKTEIERVKERAASNRQVLFAKNANIGHQTRQMKQ